MSCFCLPAVRGKGASTDRFYMGSKVKVTFGTGAFSTGAGSFVLCMLSGCNRGCTTGRRVSPVGARLPSSMRFSSLCLEVHSSVSGANTRFLGP